MTNRAHSISRNFAVLALGQVASRLVAFVTTVYMTRVLLAEHFGMIVFATSVLAYAGLIVGYGFDHLGALEVVRKRIPLADLIRNVVTFRLAMTLVGFGALVLFTRLAPMESLTRTVVLLYGISLISQALDLEWVFLGSEMMGPAVLADIVSQLLLSAGIIAVVHGPEDLTRIPWLFFASRLVSNAVLAAAYVRRFGKSHGKFDLSILKSLLPAATQLSATNFVAMISHNFDLVLVGLWLGGSALGLYGAAYRVVWAPILLIVAYYTALRPSIALAYVEGLSTIEMLLRRSTRFTSAFGIGVTVGGIMLASEIIQFLYGHAYLDARRPLQILLVSFGLMAVSRNYRTILICFNRQGVQLQMMAAAAAVNIAANLVLVPRMGLVGSAIAIVLSEATILVVGYTSVRLMIGHVPLGRFLIRPALCAVGMAVVITFSPGIHVIPRIVLAGGCYMALTLMTGAVRLEELRVVARSWTPSGTQSAPPLRVS